MIEEKLKEIREFCESNADPQIVEKYSRYFKEGFDGYGLDQKVFERQRDKWIGEWNDHMSVDDYIILGDVLMQEGRYEEKSFAISLLSSKRNNFTTSVFDRIGNWFSLGISNWATTDVLCMTVLSAFISDNIISYDKLKEWTKSGSEWQRRAVPVTLVEMVKKDLKPNTAFSMVETLMLDKSEYVQKGIGTLLRGLWKKYPEEVEDFMMKWKDSCGRSIIQYATEKMDKEHRKKFRKSK
jgi:3-methyladenine DNA glycosylase AlkD